MRMHDRTWQASFEIEEIPLLCTERTGDPSTMSTAIVREAALKVWALRLRDLTDTLGMEIAPPINTRLRTYSRPILLGEKRHSLHPSVKTFLGPYNSDTPVRSSPPAELTPPYHEVQPNFYTVICRSSRDIISYVKEVDIRLSYPACICFCQLWEVGGSFQHQY
ncbi:MAG: hypothetical protein BRD55_09590 [Bacteroidetes bacterium SW_9_63_38]|nr:MAG: hypothetical protein BRD55_09590 [Bacteroidetes bacterium SW_9_63_38]